MFLTVNGEERECALTVHTLVIYELEFDGADLIADISGRITSSDVKPDSDVLFDFTKVPWTKFMRASWAMLKTVDDTLPSFETWSRGVTQVDSWEIRSKVNAAVNENFFHTAAPDSQEGE